jgi:hypothetical protein
MWKMSPRLGTADYSLEKFTQLGRQRSAGRLAPTNFKHMGGTKPGVWGSPPIFGLTWRARNGLATVSIIESGDET